MQFFDAVKKNLIWAIDDLYHYNINLEALDRNQQTPLQRAALQGYEEMVAVLLAMGANVSKAALTTAVLGRRMGIVKQLIEAGASADAIESAIISASNRPEIEKILLKAQRAVREQQTRADEAARAAAAAEIERATMAAEVERATMAAEVERATMAAEVERATMAAEVERAVNEARRIRDAEIERVAAEARRLQIAERAAAILTAEGIPFERIAQNMEVSAPPRYPEQAIRDANGVQNMEETVSLPRYTKYKIGDSVSALINDTHKIGIVTSVNFVQGIGNKYMINFEVGENEINPI